MEGTNGGRNGCQRWSQNNSASNYWCLCPNFNLSNNVTIQCGGAGLEAIVSTSSTIGRHTYGIDVTNKIYIYDNATYSQSSITVEKAVDNFFLLANNFNETATNFVSSKLFGCEVYSNNTLIRDFIPCYRKFDGKIGLYDTVNNVFYTNAGTGEFTYPNED